MIRKFMLSAALLAAVGSLGGCFSLNMDENERMINHWGKSADEIRALTNKYFFDFDRDSPFED
jgi:hypothetical protein